MGREGDPRPGVRAGWRRGHPAFLLAAARLLWAPTRKSGRWEGRAGTGQRAAEASINFLGSSRLFRLLRFPSPVAPSSAPSPVLPARTSPAPLFRRSRGQQPEGPRPMPREGRDAVPGEGRCEGTRCRRGLQGGPRPSVLGGHTWCYRGSFDRCVASARLGGTNRPRPLAVTCSIPAGDRRCRLVVAR